MTKSKIKDERIIPAPPQISTSLKLGKQFSVGFEFDGKQGD
jgi:hypothetical protein